jgi:hypothetical protein
MLAIIANLYFLRANLTARFGDSAAAVAMTAAWTAGMLPRERTPGAIVAWATPRLLLAALVATAFTLTGMRRELDRGGFTTSAAAVRARLDSVQTMLAGLPPLTWSDRLSGGTLRAARYIAECTDPSDRILVGTYAPELPVFSGRLLAAGQRFGFGFYRSPEQQRAAIDRFRGQPVAMAVTGVADHEEFIDDYALVAEYIAARFRDAGTIAVDGQPRFRIFVDASRPVRRTHPDLGLPCLR